MESAKFSACRVPGVAGQVILACIIATAVSLLATGFTYGQGNNIFHIPYVLELSRLPQFSDDKFYRSLENFASAILPAARIITTAENVERTFLALHATSRLLTFFGLASLLLALGGREPRQITAAMLIAAVSSWLAGTSTVGGHGLLIGYFTHSEVTWFSVTAALAALCAERRWTMFVMVAITFAINAFVGFWLFFVLSVALIVQYGLTSFIRHCWRDYLAGILLCLPIAYWVASATKGQVTNFSYIEYIRVYYPQHFLIEAADASSCLKLGGFLWMGLMAGLTLPKPRLWLGVFLGCALLFLIGTFLPYVLNERYVFNLHLLRSDGLIQFIAVALTCFTATKILFDNNSSKEWPLGLAAIVPMFFPLSILGILTTCFSMTCLASKRVEIPPNGAPQSQISYLLIHAGWLIAAGLLLIAALGLTGWLKETRVAPSILGLIAAIGVVLRPNTLARFRQGILFFALISVASILAQRAYIWIATKDESTKSRAPYLELARWVEAHGPNGPYLVPLKGFEDFQHLARRPVWVEWKQGAAVMWQSSFYHQWMSRYSEIQAIGSTEALFAYARKNGIKYVVLKNDGCRALSVTIFSNPSYAVCELPSESASKGLHHSTKS